MRSQLDPEVHEYRQLGQDLVDRWGEAWTEATATVVDERWATPYADLEGVLPFAPEREGRSKGRFVSERPRGSGSWYGMTHDGTVVASRDLDEGVAQFEFLRVAVDERRRIAARVAVGASPELLFIGEELLSRDGFVVEWRGTARTDGEYAPVWERYEWDVSGALAKIELRLYAPPGENEPPRWIALPQ